MPSGAIRMLLGFRSRWTIPRSVGHMDGPGQGLREPRRPAKRLGHAPQHPGQVASADVFHGQEGQALVLADLEDLDDVGMEELGGGLGLDPQPRPFPQPGVLAGQDHLDGDDPAQVRLPGLVDDPHATPADLLERSGNCRSGAAGRPALAGETPAGWPAADESESVGISEPNKLRSGKHRSILGSSRGNRSCHSSSDGLWPSSFRVMTSAWISSRIGLVVPGQPRDNRPAGPRRAVVCPARSRSRSSAQACRKLP